MEIIESESYFEGFSKHFYELKGTLSQSGQCTVAKLTLKSPQMGLPESIVQKHILLLRSDDGTQKREYKILKICDHKNILKLFFFEHAFHGDLDSEYLHLYMEYCNEDFRKFQDGHVFSLTDISKMALQLISGCQYLHDIGVVHRDIKPENILVNKKEGSPPGDAVLKIGDFGLSRFMPKEVISPSFVYTLCGTWKYASPEIICALKNNKLTHPICNYSTDTFSLGIVIFEMITKKRPFTKKDLRQSDFNVANTVENKGLYAKNPAMYEMVMQSGIGKGLIQMLQWRPELRPPSSQLSKYFTIYDKGTIEQAHAEVESARASSQIMNTFNDGIKVERSQLTGEKLDGLEIIGKDDIAEEVAVLAEAKEKPQQKDEAKKISTGTRSSNEGTESKGGLKAKVVTAAVNVAAAVIVATATGSIPSVFYSLASEVTASVVPALLAFFISPVSKS